MPAQRCARDAGAATPEETVRAAGRASLRAWCDLDAVVVSVEPRCSPVVALDVRVQDASGTILCHFLGRRSIPGVVVGSHLRVQGRLVRYAARLCLLNPAYEFVDPPSGASQTSS